MIKQSFIHLMFNLSNLSKMPSSRNCLVTLILHGSGFHLKIVFFRELNLIHITLTLHTMNRTLKLSFF